MTLQIQLQKIIPFQYGPTCWGCPNCNQTRKTLEAIDRHILICSGQRKFSCELCDYVTTDKSRLQRHSFTHSDVKPFNCELCDYATHRKDRLKEHVEKNH